MSFPCPKGKYHAFEQSYDLPSEIIEFCNLCGLRMSYRKVNGMIDNVKYLKDHVRDFCQPIGPTAKVYAEVYGHEALSRSLEERRKFGEKQVAEDRLFSDGLEETKEALRFWKRASARGFTETEIKKMILEI